MTNVVRDARSSRTSCGTRARPTPAEHLAVVVTSIFVVARGRNAVSLLDVADDEIEETLAGGFANVVVRKRQTVRRDCGPWTPAVHALLRHLEDVGFGYAPKVLGIDDQGREVLAFIEGKTAWWPWPEALLTDDGLRSVASMVKDLAASVATFDEPGGAVWHGGPRTDPQFMLRHGDLAPWNTLWVDGRLVALIDWDTAEPAPPLWDAAQAAWYFVPLRPAAGYRSGAFPSEAEQIRRFRVWCVELGVDPAMLVSVVEDVQEFERDRIVDRGGAGVEPYATFLARGDVEDVDADRAWLAAHRDGLGE